MDRVTLGTVGELAAFVQGLLTRPRSAWQAVSEDDGLTIAAVCRSYIARLAAIPAVSRLIASQVFGYEVFGLRYRPPLVEALATAIMHYAASFLAVGLLAWLIAWLAPRFGGTADRTRAFRLAALSFTPFWLAGVFTLVPPLGAFALLGLYGFYLLYAGLPILMRTPPGEALPYGVSATAVWIGSLFTVGFVIALVSNGGPSLPAGSPSPSAEPVAAAPTEQRRGLFGLTDEERDANREDYLRQVEEQAAADKAARCRDLEMAQIWAPTEDDANIASVGSAQAGC